MLRTKIRENKNEAVLCLPANNETQAEKLN